MRERISSRFWPLAIGIAVLGVASIPLAVAQSGDPASPGAGTSGNATGTYSGSGGSLSRPLGAGATSPSSTQHNDSFFNQRSDSFGSARSSTSPANPGTPGSGLNGGGAASSSGSSVGGGLGLSGAGTPAVPSGAPSIPGAGATGSSAGAIVIEPAAPTPAPGAPGSGFGSDTFGSSRPGLR